MDPARHPPSLRGAAGGEAIQGHRTSPALDRHAADAARDDGGEGGD
jgi:hypothetical protein